MTPEELDEARAKEAQRLWESGQEAGSSSWVVAARLAREGWTPPEPVDPDIWAFMEWWGSEEGDGDPKRAYLAGARMAREQERERAKPLVRYAEHLKHGFFLYANYREHAAQALAKYRGEA